MLDKELLDILCCPACKSDITYDEKNFTLNCENCRKAYPVKDGIPIMLEEEAKNLDELNK